MLKNLLDMVCAFAIMLVLGTSIQAQELEYVDEYDWTDLTADQKADINSVAKKGKYSEGLNFSALQDSFIYFKINNIPSRSGKKETQYYVKYIENGESYPFFITIDEPDVSIFTGSAGAWEVSFHNGDSQLCDLAKKKIRTMKANGHSEIQIFQYLRKNQKDFPESNFDWLTLLTEIKNLGPLTNY